MIFSLRMERVAKSSFSDKLLQQICLLFPAVLVSFHRVAINFLRIYFIKYMYRIFMVYTLVVRC